MTSSTASQGVTAIDWTAAAIMSAALFAVVSITDKVIMTGMGLRVRGFLLFIGFQTLITAVTVAIVNPFPSADTEVYVRGVGVGLMWGVSAPLVLWTLSREEVSRVTPISQSHPLLVVIFAVVLLGESLSLLESVAATLAIGGAVLAAVRLSDAGQIRLSGSLAFLGIAVVVIALAQILLKTVTDDLSFWHAMALRSVGMSFVLMLMNFRIPILVELGRFMWSPARFIALALDAAAATIAMTAITFAIATGPVSLANAFASTTPLFVFFATMFLAWKTRLLRDEVLDRRAISQKLLAAGMVVGGLVLIALT
ncbi:MAG: EamA family transporter [Chloroflexi bacterium]|nr:EamA family transporter [Chloroflexota bacterium]